MISYRNARLTPCTAGVPPASARRRRGLPPGKKRRARTPGRSRYPEWPRKRDHEPHEPHEPHEWAAEVTPSAGTVSASRDGLRAVWAALARRPLSAAAGRATNPFVVFVRFVESTFLSETAAPPRPSKKEKKGWARTPALRTAPLYRGRPRPHRRASAEIARERAPAPGNARQPHFVACDCVRLRPFASFCVRSRPPARAPASPETAYGLEMMYSSFRPPAVELRENCFQFFCKAGPGAGRGGAHAAQSRAMGPRQPLATLLRARRAIKEGRHERHRGGRDGGRDAGGRSEPLPVRQRAAGPCAAAART